MATRAVSALTTFVVALLLALSVPTSQLRTVSITKSCCCPDPTKCHCPDHQKSRPGQPELRACHQTTEVNVAATLPAFTRPVVMPVTEATVVGLAPLSSHAAPHAPPIRARPDAPS
ncbi:MAG: hypothetical protein IPQ07_39165 [Myxococcales bacterium]|nr:hypothetical protein [Myxococcales bacterium]